MVDTGCILNAWPNFRSDSCTSKERKKEASKENIQISICPEISGLESNWKITFNNKYLDYVTFHLQLTQYIHNTVSN